MVVEVVRETEEVGLVGGVRGKRRRPRRSKGAKMLLLWPKGSHPSQVPKEGQGVP